MTSLKPTFLLFLLLSIPSTSRAQEEAEPAEGNEEARDEARRLLVEAQDHSDAGRHALAAERYLTMYDVMHEAGLPRASIALYSAGRALAEVPGREREARETLQRFLTESTTLTDDPQVRDWRSNAVEEITELDARIEVAAPEEEDAPNEIASAPPEGGTISPVGPIVLGIGGAAVLAGLITGGVALAEGDDLRARCGGSVCPDSDQGRIDNVTALSNATDALLFGGAAVAVVGLVLTLVLREGDSAEGPRAAFSCSARGCAASVGGSF